MATIAAFRSAMAAPNSSFSHLANIRPRGGEIVRSTHFAEAEVECGSKRMMIYMPLAGLSLRRVERFIPLKRHLCSRVIPELKILREEMSVTDSMGRLRREDILCEPLPDALPFADAVAAINDAAEAASMVAALDELQHALEQADVSHNNVCQRNILIDADYRLHLVRWYYATDGAGGDSQAFALLREQILSKGDLMSVGDVSGEQYSAEPRLEGHLTVRFMREGLAAVEHDTGWGFVDEQNRMVIEPRYEWVGDFCEGRAEVQGAEGMGLIDKRGEYIIPPHYSVVEYDVSSGRSWVLGAQGWAIFDYEGHPLCHFGECEPCEM